MGTNKFIKGAPHEDDKPNYAWALRQGFHPLSILRNLLWDIRTSSSLLMFEKGDSVSPFSLA